MPPPPSAKSPSSITGIHHVGIAVRSLTSAYRFYRETLGLPLIKEAEVGDQGVRAALLAAGDTEIELLEPVGVASGMEKFIARHGEGLHHVCFATPDVARELTAARDKGAELIDATPRDGLAGRIGFLHPRACAGVLVELATPFEAAAPHVTAGAVRFESLVIGAKTPRATAAEFQRLFAFPEIPAKGGARLRLAVGPRSLVIAPAGEVDGVEGMAAIAMVARDLEAVRQALESAGARPAPRGFGIMPATGATHGVPIHITREE